MPLLGILVFTIFPIFATGRLTANGLPSLLPSLLGAWAILLVMFLLTFEIPSGWPEIAEGLAYSLIYSAPLLFGSAIMTLARRRGVSLVVELVLTYSAQCIAIIPAFWLAVFACLQIRGSFCTMP